MAAQTMDLQYEEEENGFARTALDRYTGKQGKYKYKYKIQKRTQTQQGREWF